MSVVSRRDALKQLSAAVILGPSMVWRRATDIVVAGRPVEIAVASVSATTVRVTLRPVVNGSVAPIPPSGELASDELGRIVKHARDGRTLPNVLAGNLVVKFTNAPPTIQVES